MTTKWSLILPLAVAACLLGCAAARAERIHLPPEIINTVDPLRGDQQAVVEKAVDEALAGIAKAPDAEVATLCSDLRDPLGQSNSGVFKQAYVSVLERKLPGVLTLNPPARPVARCNVMSVFYDLADDEPTPAALLPAVHLGLADRGVGCGATIYWAARLAGKLADTGKLPAAEEKGLLADLASAAVAIEKTTPQASNWSALGGINQALAHLNDPAAADELLAGMERRFPLYIADTGLPVGPERDGLIELYIKKYTIAPPPTPVVIRLTTITYRYLDMAGKLCDTDAESLFVPAPESARPDLRRFIEAASNILRWASVTLKGPNLQPMPNPLPMQRDWIKVQGVIHTWGQALTAAPFKIAEADLLALVQKKKNEKTPD